MMGSYEYDREPLREEDYYDCEPGFLGGGRPCGECGCRESVVELVEEFDAYAENGATGVFQTRTTVCVHCDLGEPPCPGCTTSEA